MITGLIYDRTAEDVAFARRIAERIRAGEELTAAESAAWAAGCKGCYNAADLNRVQDAATELADKLTLYGYYDAVPAPHGDWVAIDVPTQADWIAYTGMAHTNRRCFYVFPDTPPLPEIGAPLDYVGANAIERTIYDQSVLLDRLIEAFRKSGTFAAGEEYNL